MIKIKSTIENVIVQRPKAVNGYLVANSGLPPETLVEIGSDHRLADEESLGKMLEACERIAGES